MIGKRLLITDLDDTLWDWFGQWYASYSLLFDELSLVPGVDREVLLSQARSLHQKHGTTEYSNLLNEIPILREAAAPQEPHVHFDDILYAFRRERLDKTRLFPGVLEALLYLKGRNVRIVAYTESIYYWSKWRIRRTGLDGIIDILYAAPDSKLPEGDRTPLQLEHTRARETAAGLRKPQPDVLQEILREQRCSPTEAAYIGDSLMKDVHMAQRAGVSDVWAEYGVAYERHPDEYMLLRQVSHWSSEDIERERSLAASRQEVVPTLAVDAFEGVVRLFK